MSEVGSTPPPDGQGPGDFPLGDSAFDVFALVVLLLALTEGEGDFGPPVVEVELERDQGQALSAPRRRSALDFPAVQKEFPRANRVVVAAIALLVGRDVHAFEQDLPVSEMA